MVLVQRLSLSVIHLLALVFLILVSIGNINRKSVIRSTWFLKIDLSNIIPQSVPNAVLINSIAQTLGLHDFYQIGLWNFCEGYDDEGITHCSPAKSLYWFDPVEVIASELLAGASISLPSNINSALKLIRTASRWMFGLYITGTVLTFVCIFLAPIAVSSQPRSYHRGRRVFLRSIPLMVLSFLAALTVAVASVIATVMFFIFRNVLTSQSDLNIGAEVGKPMLAFMWTATGFALIGFFWQFGTCCAVCCCSGKNKKTATKSSPEKGSGTTEKSKPGSVDGMKRRFRWRNNRIGA